MFHPRPLYIVSTVCVLTLGGAVANVGPPYFYNIWKYTSTISKVCYCPLAVNSQEVIVDGNSCVQVEADGSILL